MGSEAKSNGIANSEGFKSRVNRYLHSGDTKHVMAGMVIITLVFGVPWFLMNRGSSEQTSDTFKYVVPNEILFTFQTGSKRMETWSSKSNIL
ncbi:hypothetical protein POPTR_003G183501v4 [Populus trichocarpa]|uniref:Uncharacterized protein n=2 Tax=Populus TaxID=3689 RepID=A0ACC0TAD2_POPTR|nr:hypothetical protein BDE02_03G166600 [Populus trichocarpa]KAI9398447.1 hypothetical protein POPTR_003G183501v4 [Populus trichocarpa]KAJ7004825.1 hypothetical protein NC653_009612 [Populus alba x Populus x berolinensis]KAJ7004832.1 hypothetical protein NC653_009618 [Populus alba x Populus x berolinensis]